MMKNFEYSNIMNGKLHREDNNKFKKFEELSKSQIDLMIEERKARNPTKYITFFL